MNKITNIYELETLINKLGLNIRRSYDITRKDDQLELLMKYDFYKMEITKHDFIILKCIKQTKKMLCFYGNDDYKTRWIKNLDQCLKANHILNHSFDN